MSNLQIEGKLYLVMETQKVSESFQKREFVLLTDEDSKYPQHVKFELAQDKCSLLDFFADGQAVTVHFNLRGREWSGKYFTNLQAWKIEAAATTSAPAPARAARQQPAPPAFPTAPRKVTTETDDLPF